MTKYKVSVYKIYWDDSDDIYIGSTKQKLSYRVATHRARSKKNSNFKKNCRLHLKMAESLDFKYVLIDSATVSSADEKKRLEQKYIDELKPKLNMIRATSLPHRYKGWEEDDKLKEIERKKQEIINAKNKRWSEKMEERKKRNKEKRRLKEIEENDDIKEEEDIKTE